MEILESIGYIALGFMPTLALLEKLYRIREKENRYTKKSKSKYYISITIRLSGVRVFD